MCVKKLHSHPGGTPQGGLSCPSGNPPSGGPEGVGRGMRRKAERQHKQTDLCQSFHEVGTLVEVFTFPKSLHCRPHSSSVMEIAFGDFHDSFSPGEAIGCCHTRGFFVSLKNWAKREHGTNSPENYRASQVVLRNGHNRSLHWYCPDLEKTMHIDHHPGRTTRVLLDCRYAQCWTACLRVLPVPNKTHRPPPGTDHTSSARLPRRNMSDSLPPARPI